MVCLPTAILATLLILAVGGTTGAASALYFLSRLANTFKRD